MKSIIFTLMFMLGLSLNLLGQMKSFVIINWTTETFNEGDFEIKNELQSGEMVWGKSLREYSAKEINIKDYPNRGKITAIKIMQKDGTEAVLDSMHTAIEFTSRQSNMNLKASLITTTLTNEIIAVNICEINGTQRRPQEYVVINLTNYVLPYIMVIYGDEGLTEATLYDEEIPAYSIRTVPIASLPILLPGGIGAHIGKPVLNPPFYPCDNCGVVNNNIIYDCASDNSQQMIVGVEISNSGPPLNVSRVVVHKPK